MEQSFIKGEYTFDITIFTMFDVYNIKVHHHNMILSQGLTYFLNRWISNFTPNTKKSDLIGKICIGNCPENDDIDITQTTLTSPIKDSLGNIYYIIPETIEVKGNQLILSAKTNGETLNNTTEIGVATNESEILVSRDVHPIYQIPTTAIVQLDYIFTLEGVDNTQSEEMEEWL